MQSLVELYIIKMHGAGVRISKFYSKSSSTYDDHHHRHRRRRRLCRPCLERMSGSFPETCPFKSQGILWLSICLLVAQCPFVPWVGTGEPVLVDGPCLFVLGDLTSFSDMFSNVLLCFLFSVCFEC